MKFLLRLIALPVLILFIIAFPLSLVMRNLGALIFDAQTTKAFVHESLMGSEFARSLARRGATQLVSSEGGEGQISAAVFAQLTEEDWRQITDIIAPEAAVSETVDVIIDSFSTWLNDADAEFPNLQVDLAPWKTGTIQKADQLVTVFLDALPECSQAAAANLALQDVTTQAETLPVCRPPEPLYGQMVTHSTGLIERIVNTAPDRIDIDQVTEGADAPQELIDLKASLIQLRFWLGWGWLAVLGAGLLAAWMASAGLKSFLVWLGWPLLLAGGLVLTFGLAVFVFQFQFLDQLFAAAQASPAVTVLGAAVAGGALQLIGAPLIFQGLLSLGAGLGALAYARSLHSKEVSPGIPINRRRIRL
ncbi:MAG TPA: hypothetical protein VF982_03895 [Anaerolineales bacterium]|jgi:hypothetical protein